MRLAYISAQSRHGDFFNTYKQQANGMSLPISGSGKSMTEDTTLAAALGSNTVDIIFSDLCSGSMMACLQTAQRPLAGGRMGLVNTGSRG